MLHDIYIYMISKLIKVVIIILKSWSVCYVSFVIILSVPMPILVHYNYNSCYLENRGDDVLRFQKLL